MAKFNIGDIVNFERNIFILKNNTKIVFVYPVTGIANNINISPSPPPCPQTYIIEYENGWTPVGKYNLDPLKKYLFALESELTLA